MELSPRSEITSDNMQALDPNAIQSANEINRIVSKAGRYS